MTNNLQKLKAVIQAAIPEIMELKMGCELQYLGYQKVIICGRQLGFWKVWCERGGESVFITVTNEQLKFSEVIQILGRPIRLADVLVAIAYKDKRRFACDELGNILEYNSKGEIIEGLVAWNLLDDNLDHQSDECLTFLINLLVHD